jgi:hypothetical protein
MSLKSIDDHNAERLRKRMEAEAAYRRTGVACPKCGGELLWFIGAYLQTMQYPAPTTAPARCEPCGVEVRIER